MSFEVIGGDLSPLEAIRVHWSLFEVILVNLRSSEFFKKTFLARKFKCKTFSNVE